MGAKLNAGAPLVDAYRDRFDGVPLPDGVELDELLALARAERRRTVAAARLEALGGEPRRQRAPRRPVDLKLWKLTRVKIAPVVERYARKGNGKGGRGLPAILSPRCAHLFQYVIANVDLLTGEYHSTREKTAEGMNVAERTAQRAAADVVVQAGGLLERIDCPASTFSFRVPDHLRSLDAIGEHLYQAAREAALPGRGGDIQARNGAATAPSEVMVSVWDVSPTPLDPIPESPASAPPGTLSPPATPSEPGKRVPRREEKCLDVASSVGAATSPDLNRRPVVDRGATAPVENPTDSIPVGVASSSRAAARDERESAVPAPPARLPTAPPGIGRESRGGESTRDGAPQRPVAGSARQERTGGTPQTAGRVQAPPSAAQGGPRPVFARAAGFDRDTFAIAWAFSHGNDGKPPDTPGGAAPSDDGPGLTADERAELEGALRRRRGPS